MKVLMQGRFGLLEAAGGDRIQVENTAEQLKRLGVKVDITTSLNVDASDFDLVHIFQLDWTTETHFMVKNAKKHHKPVVFSPIHHKVEEVKKFDDEHVFGLRRLSKILFEEQHTRDTFKNIYRSVTNPSKFMPTLYSIIHGLKNMHIETLSLSDVILVQTKLEATDLKKTYGVDIKWVKVPSGVSEKFLYAKDYKNPLPLKDYVFCVGRIEPRKNQLNVIEAVEKLREDSNQDLKLVFVGKKNILNHPEYTLRFNNFIKKHTWITYIESVPYKKIPAYFTHAKVCVSASWFETTGLTLLEALFCGTNAVASSPRAEEILGDYASYCRPWDVGSIKKAIGEQFFANRPKLDVKMRQEYTWENAAKKTYKVYSDLLGK